MSIRVGRMLRITNVYLPPSLRVREWEAALDAAVPYTPTEHDAGIIHVLMGDWNVRLGEQTGGTKVNHRASSFDHFVQSKHLAVIPFKTPKATLCDTRLRTSVPDFALVSVDHLNRCSPVVVLDEDNGGSDHFPIVIDVVVKREGEMVQNPRRIAVELLEKSERTRRAYSKGTNKSLWRILVKSRKAWSVMRKGSRGEIGMVQNVLDDLASTFTNALTLSAERHCGRRKGDGRRAFPKSVLRGNRVLMGLRGKRVRLLKQLRAFKGTEEAIKGVREELKGVNKEFRERIKALRGEKERKFFDAMEEKSLGEQQRILRFAEHESQQRGTKMLSTEGLPEYTRHFADMFSFRAEFPDMMKGDGGDDSGEGTVEILSREEFEGMRRFFSKKVVHDLVIRESGGKAAGCSGVSAEMMRPVPRAVGATLSLLAEMIYCTGLCPEVFRKSNITPVPRKLPSGGSVGANTRRI